MIDLNVPWPYLAATAIVTLMGIFVWRQPHRPGTHSFMGLILTWIVWFLAAGLSTITHDLNMDYGLWVLQTITILVGIPLTLMIALEYTGSEKWLGRLNPALLVIPALIFGVYAYSFPIRLVEINTVSGELVISAVEPFRWVLYAYICLLTLMALWAYITCMLRAPAFTPPLLMITLGVLIPLMGYLWIDPRMFNVPPIQVTSLLTVISALTYSVALYSFNLLQVIPVAHDTVLHNMPYAMIVLDAADKLVDFNQAVKALPGLPKKLVLRQSAGRALGSWWGRIAPLIGPQAAAGDVSITYGVEQCHFHIYSLPLLHTSGWRIGQVFILEDVTRAHQAQRQQAQSLWAQATQQEREQLANELHDGLSQNLAFLNLQAQAAQVYLQFGQNEAAQASLLRLTGAAGQIQEETRQLIADLLSISLPAENFTTALSQILAGFEQHSHLAVHLDIDPADKGEETFSPASLPPQIAVQLIRITQEALTNVRKHARGATRVDVRLKNSRGQARLTIADDGAGFNLEAQPDGGHHFGLTVMRQRAARIGGTISIHSAPGEGTCIEVCTPLALVDSGNSE